MGKVRFGVSLPEELGRQLDELARKVNVSRSELVEMAIKSMIADYMHYLVPHDCKGVMVALCPGDSGSERVVEEFSDVISTYVHSHQDNMCLEVLLLSGPSRRISELHGRLTKIGCGVRFLPSLSLSSYDSSRPPRPPST